MKRNGIARSLLIGVAAGTLYGLWAVYANWGHAVAQVARAAATQFALSFCSTSFLTLAIELVLARGRSLPKLVLAAVGPQACMVTFLVVVHAWSGTPNVLRTVAPSALVGLAFCVLYVVKRRQTPADVPAPATP